MATISTTVSATSGSSTAQCTLTATYSVSSTSPTATTVTSTTLTASAIRVSGGTSTTQATARSNLVVTMIGAIVELTFGGNRVTYTAGVTESTTVTFSGNNSVAKGHSATTSPLKLTAMGKTSTVNISVPVRTSFAVTFNANSGESAPTKQIKWYDETLQITTDKPTKTNYTCIGWATSTTIAGTGEVEYVPSQNYTDNAGLDLYAVWQRNYQKPTIDNLHVDRCKLKDGEYVLDDDGTFAKVTFTWGVFRTNDPLYYGGSDTSYSTNAVDSCTVQVGTQTATPTLTGASGTYSAVVGDGSFSTDNSYAVSVSITDTQIVESDKTTTVEGLLSMAQFPMDINANATAIGFFRPAPDAPEEGAFFGKNVDAPTYSVNGTALIDFFYPVGSYYETSDTSFNPNNAWVGTTWVEDTAGRVLVSAGTNAGVTYSTGATGGNKDAIVPYHRHGVASFNFSGGPHSHSLDGTASSVASGSNYTRPRGAGTATANQYVTTSTTHTHTLPAHDTNYAGTSGNATNANMQPYIVVKRWHRTA